MLISVARFDIYSHINYNHNDMRHLLQRLSVFFLKPELLFISLAIPFGILSAIMVPQLSVADENMHFLKAYSVASGNLNGRDCSYPKEVHGKAGATFNNQFDASYRKKIDQTNTIVGSCGSAAVYTPIMHIPQAIGIWAAKAIHPSTGMMVLVGRLANLFFFVAIMYYIIKKVRVGKWVFVVLGLLPLSIHSAASLSADTMNNVIVLAFAAFVFNLCLQKQKISNKQILVLLSLSGLLALTKLTNVVLLLPLVFLPVRLFAENRTKLPFNIQKWGLAVMCGVFGLLLVVVWQEIYGSSVIETTEDNLLTSNPFYFLTILSNTYLNPFIGYGDAVVQGIVGGFASYKYHLPIFVTFLCFLTLFIALLHKDKKGALQAFPLGFALGSVGAICLLVIVVTYAMYMVWATLPTILGPGATYAFGVQGRYFTAALILLLPFFLWLRQFISIETKSQTMGVIVFGSTTFWLLFYTIETYRFITSNT